VRRSPRSRGILPVVHPIIDRDAEQIGKFPGRLNKVTSDFGPDQTIYISPIKTPSPCILMIVFLYLLYLLPRCGVQHGAGRLSTSQAQARIVARSQVPPLTTVLSWLPTSKTLNSMKTGQDHFAACKREETEAFKDDYRYRAGIEGTPLREYV